MIKARPVTGHPAAQQSLVKMLNGFVYRRYTDFSVIAALREMKSMMRSEVTRLGIDQDLKRGEGGIREIEFIAQSLQLVHGGRMPELQCTPLLHTCWSPQAISFSLYFSFSFSFSSPVLFFTC